MDLTETTAVAAAGEAAVELLGERMSLTVVARSSPAAMREALVADVRRGLGAPRKWMPPRWFYDDRGCDLFEQITRLPEYYQTRTEAAILDATAARIAETARAEVLVELGAGSCTKTRILIDAMLRRGLQRFVPVDVSEAAITAAGRGLTADFPGLHVHGVVADFDQALARLPGDDRQAIAFLGSTIGNLLPHQRVDLLGAVRTRLGRDGTLILGLDLVKPAAELHAAYNDAAGVTAAFNRNLLGVLNRELGAGFDESAFAHEAPWVAACERIEMHLRSRAEQWVDIPGAGMRVHFAAGETVLTEISAKFTRERIAGELSAAGLSVVEWFTDAAERFALCLSRPA
jgi:L-histidine N-alpha-methyltransferase